MLGFPCGENLLPAWGSGRRLDWHGSSTVRTPGFQPGNQGSTPCRATR